MKPMPFTSKLAAGCVVLASAAAVPVARLARPQSPVAAARVLDVPQSFPTIQAAIDSARRGDTVMVAPGRYFENIRFKGKGVVVTSRYARTRDAVDITRTIIDGSRPSHRDSASVVMFVNQEDANAVLQGFTITGGRGTVWLDAKDRMYFREGGGILCDLAGPTIRFNHIVDNEALQKGDSVKSAGGGGIRCGYAEPTITNNVIRGNRGRYGAGIVLFHSAATVRNNLIVGNEGGQDFGGAGVWVVGSLSRRLPNVLEYNTIVGNKSITDSTRVPKTLQGLAGGVWTSWVRVVFSRNLVWGNAQAELGQLEFPPDPLLTMQANVIENGVDGAPAGHGTLTTNPGLGGKDAYRITRPSMRSAAGRDLYGAFAGPGGRFTILP